MWTQEKITGNQLFDGIEEKTFEEMTFVILHERNIQLQTFKTTTVSEAEITGLPLNSSFFWRR